MFRTPSFLLTFVLFAALHQQARADLLGTAQGFAVLAGSMVTSSGPTVVSGNLGVWSGTSIIGFPPGLVVSGTVHAGDAVAMQAQSDVTTAYDVLAGMALTQDLTGQDLGGLTLTPGVYFFSTSAQLTGTLTLDTQGNPNSLFVFQIGSTLTTATNSIVATINGPDDCNVYWQVGSSATLGTGTMFQGNILALASITLNTGATILSGRALARNGAVTMDGSHVVAACTCILEPTSQDCNMNGIPDECDSPSALPHFTTCGESPQGSVGVPLSFEVCATAGSPGTPITLTLLGFPTVPAGATLSVPLPATGDTVCTTFTWTPTIDQVGATVLQFWATDANGCMVECKMRILIVETFLLFGPDYGSNPFMIYGHLYGTQLTRLLRALPVTEEHIPSFPYDALPSHYFVQVVMHSPLQYPSQPHRWSYAMEFTKVLPGQTLVCSNSGTMNGINITAQTYTEPNGQVRVRFPFHVQ